MKVYESSKYSLFDNNISPSISRFPDIYRENNSDTASLAKLQRLEKEYKFTYTKTDKIKNNYAACFFPLEDLEIDLGDYSKVEVNGDFGKAKLVPINLSLHYDDKRVRYITSLIEIKTGVKKYKLNINEFKTPPSWFRINKSILDSLPVVTLKNTKTLSITSCHLLDSRIEDTYLIHSIIFKKDTKKWLWIFLISDCILLLGWFMFYLKMFKSKKEFIHIPVEPIDLENPESHLQNILDFISKNYQNSELTVGVIAKSLGISKNEIPKLIKDKMKLSFPQYLSKVRVEEAKRLFSSNSNKSISEVGYYVGFNSPSNFNRVFKSIEGCSPKDFIENK